MGESNLIDYAKYLTSEMPEEISIINAHFTIEISIVMKKPRGHFSRAPGVVLDILNAFEGGTFFEGQGFWRGVQEPVVYIFISKQSDAGTVLNQLKNKIELAQLKLKQQEMFVKINGCSFIGSLIEKEVTDKFPDQWEFDDDMKRITANQSRKDEHYKLIYGRVDYHRKDYSKAQQKWTEMINEFAGKDSLSQKQKRDLLKCYTNILSPKLKLEPKYIEEICQQFNVLLPAKQESGFSDEVLSKHAEARMRGNRVKLFTQIEQTLLSDIDLLEDGIYAINQIVTHLEKNQSPYLDFDPIKDIHTIIKHIKKIDSYDKSEIAPIIDSLIAKYPQYKDDFQEVKL